MILHTCDREKYSLTFIGGGENYAGMAKPDW